MKETEKVQKAMEEVYPLIVLMLWTGCMYGVWKLGKKAGIVQSSRAVTEWLNTYMPEHANEIWKFMREHPEALKWQ